MSRVQSDRPDRNLFLLILGLLALADLSFLAGLFISYYL